MKTRVDQSGLATTLGSPSKGVERFKAGDRVTSDPGSGLFSPEQSHVSSDSTLPSLPKPDQLEQGSRNSFLSNIPFYVIGLLLTATALAKLWMLLTDSFADIRVGIPKEILWLSVAFELWLAFENFRVRHQNVMAFVNTVVFAAFAIFGTVRWLMGYTSCGCSGNLELPAWIFVFFDIVIVGGFIRNSQARIRIQKGWKATRFRLKADPRSIGKLLGLIIVLAAILILGFSGNGSRLLSVQNNDIKGSRVNLGAIPVEAKVKCTIKISNVGRNSCRIVGVQRSCVCVVPEDCLGIQFPPGKDVDIPVEVIAKTLGGFHHRVLFYLDSPQQHVVAVDLFGFGFRSER